MRTILALLSLLVTVSVARAQADVQWTRERDATLVSKDVGAERWAITYRLADGRATGNVYRTDGGPASFLDCRQTGRDGSNVTFDCYGANACAEAPCPSSQYSLIASGVTLPLSFFFPPGDVPGGATIENLVGTWEFVVDPDDDPTRIRYRIDRVEEDDGDVFAVGENEDTGNDIIAFASDGRFVLLDESTFNCSKFEFDFVTFDRLEGSRLITLFIPFFGDCDDDPIDTDPFVAERIE